jgi:uncharacterized protein YcbK (DUF882 family)
MVRRSTFWLALLLLTRPAAAEEPDRFFFMGTGELKIRSTKNKHRFSGRYRTKDGRYRRAALRRINRVFGANINRDGGRISLRLIELYSKLRADLKGGWVIISSGYRGPEYNKKIRDAGGTVALSSLHQYGMAADIRITGVKSKKIWELVRAEKLGGAGYYGSRWVHIDVGYARSWTQGTANVRKGRSVENKLIQLVPWFDVYRPGELLRLRFVRMTAFPIGVKRRFVLERETGGGEWKKVRTFRPGLGKKGRCPAFGSIASMARIRWRLPADLAPGRYRARADFCNRKWKKMPKKAVSRAFQIVAASPP